MNDVDYKELLISRRVYREKQRIDNPEAYLRRLAKNRLYKEKFKKTNPEKIKLYRAKWEKANPEKEKRIVQRGRFKKKYGIKVEDYEIMYSGQWGMCGICGCSKKSSLEVGSSGRDCLHVDHCHLNSNVRSLLCHKCNTLLGFADDNILVLQNAINYLEYHTI